MKKREKTEQIERFEACRTAMKRIEELDERKQRIRSIAEKCTQVITADSGGGERSNAIEEAIVKLDELNEELSQEALQLVQNWNECKKVLEGLPENEKRVMELYYMDGLKWQEVAKKTNYSIQNCFRIQEKVLMKSME